MKTYKVFLNVNVSVVSYVFVEATHYVAGDNEHLRFYEDEIGSPIATFAPLQWVGVMEEKGE